MCFGLVSAPFSGTVTAVTPRRATRQGQGFQLVRDLPARMSGNWCDKPPFKWSLPKLFLKSGRGSCPQPSSFSMHSLSS